MKKIIILFSLAIITMQVICAQKNTQTYMIDKTAQAEIFQFRKHPPFFFSKKAKLYRYFFDYLSTACAGALMPEGIDTYFKQGVNPNFCIGEAGWSDSNPLLIISGSRYDHTVIFNNYGKDPDSDIKTLNALIQAGADVNLFPYVWYLIYGNKNYYLREIRSELKRANKSEEEITYRLEKWVEYSDRLLEAFIQAGADPDMRGDPYPFDWEKTRWNMTDEIAVMYFKAGTRPINEAIKKGMAWEPEVDLLLKYVKLDEDSVKAAKASGDSAMVEKIELLWDEQEKKDGK